MKNIVALTLLLLSTTLSWGQCVGDTTSKNVKTVYIVPLISNSQLYSSWAPVLDKIGKDTKQCLEIHIPNNIPDFENFVLSGKPDYVFMNPYHQVMAYKAQGYIPLIADTENKLDGIIVVRNDSPIKDIKELDGQSVAFPAPNSFGASLIVRSILANNNIKIKPVFVNTHTNVYRCVLIKDHVAGGGVNTTFDREPDGVKDKLRILYRSPSYTAHPFSVNPRIPKATRDAVIESFMDLGSTDQGITLLKNIQIPKPSKVYYNKDYAPLESLGLERFVNNGKN